MYSVLDAAKYLLHKFDAFGCVKQVNWFLSIKGFIRFVEPVGDLVRDFEDFERLSI